MIVRFTRSGGFSGIRLTSQVDTASLPPDQADAVRRMVEGADFRNLPETTTAPATRGADRFEYVVTVEEEGRQHTVRTTDAAVPDALRPLLDYLTKAARARGSGGGGGRP
jgi:hypothetical protein